MFILGVRSCVSEVGIKDRKKELQLMTSHRYCGWNDLSLPLMSVSGAQVFKLFQQKVFCAILRFYGAGTHPLKSLKLMGKSGTRKCHLRVPDLQMRCRHMIRMGGYQGCNFEDGNTSMDRHGHPLNKSMMDQLIVPFIRHHTRVVNSSRYEVLTPSPLRDVDDVSQLYCSTPFYELKSWSCPVKIAYH